MGSIGSPLPSSVIHPLGSRISSFIRALQYPGNGGHETGNAPNLHPNNPCAQDPYTQVPDVQLPIRSVLRILDPRTSSLHDTAPLGCFPLHRVLLPRRYTHRAPYHKAPEYGDDSGSTTATDNSSNGDDEGPSQWAADEGRPRGGGGPSRRLGLWRLCSRAVGGRRRRVQHHDGSADEEAMGWLVDSLVTVDVAGRGDVEEGPEAEESYAEALRLLLASERPLRKAFRRAVRAARAGQLFEATVALHPGVLASPVTQAHTAAGAAPLIKPIEYHRGRKASAAHHSLREGVSYIQITTCLLPPDWPPDSPAAVQSRNPRVARTHLPGLQLLHYAATLAQPPHLHNGMQPLFFLPPVGGAAAALATAAASRASALSVKSLAVDSANAVIWLLDYASGAVLYQNHNAIVYMGEAPPADVMAAAEVHDPGQQQHLRRLSIASATAAAAGDSRPTPGAFRVPLLLRELLRHEPGALERLQGCLEGGEEFEETVQVPVSLAPFLSSLRTSSHSLSPGVASAAARGMAPWREHAAQSAAAAGGEDGTHTPSPSQAPSLPLARGGPSRLSRKKVVAGQQHGTGSAAAGSSVGGDATASPPAPRHAAAWVLHNASSGRLQGPTSHSPKHLPSPQHPPPHLFNSTVATAPDQPGNASQPPPQTSLSTAPGTGHGGGGGGSQPQQLLWHASSLLQQGLASRACSGTSRLGRMTLPEDAAPPSSGVQGLLAKLRSRQSREGGATTTAAASVSGPASPPWNTASALTRTGRSDEADDGLSDALMLSPSPEMLMLPLAPAAALDAAAAASASSPSGLESVAVTAGGVSPPTRVHALQRTRSEQHGGVESPAAAVAAAIEAPGRQAHLCSRPSLDTAILALRSAAATISVRASSGIPVGPLPATGSSAALTGGGVAPGCSVGGGSGGASGGSSGTTLVNLARRVTRFLTRTNTFVVGSAGSNHSGCTNVSGSPAASRYLRLPHLAGGGGNAGMSSPLSGGRVALLEDADTAEVWAEETDGVEEEGEEELREGMLVGRTTPTRSTPPHRIYNSMHSGVSGVSRHSLSLQPPPLPLPYHQPYQPHPAAVGQRRQVTGRASTGSCGLHRGPQSGLPAAAYSSAGGSVRRSIGANPRLTPYESAPAAATFSGFARGLTNASPAQIAAAFGLQISAASSAAAMLSNLPLPSPSQRRYGGSSPRAPSQKILVPPRRPAPVLGSGAVAGQGAGGGPSAGFFSGLGGAVVCGREGNGDGGVAAGDTSLRPRGGDELQMTSRSNSIIQALMSLPERSHFFGRGPDRRRPVGTRTIATSTSANSRCSLDLRPGSTGGVGAFVCIAQRAAAIDGGNPSQKNPPASAHGVPVKGFTSGAGGGRMSLDARGDEDTSVYGSGKGKCTAVCGGVGLTGELSELEASPFALRIDSVTALKKAHRSRRPPPRRATSQSLLIVRSPESCGLDATLKPTATTATAASANIPTTTTTIATTAAAGSGNTALCASGTELLQARAKTGTSRVSSPKSPWNAAAAGECGSAAAAPAAASGDNAIEAAIAAAASTSLPLVTLPTASAAANTSLSAHASNITSSGSRLVAISNNPSTALPATPAKPAVPPPLPLPTASVSASTAARGKGASTAATVPVNLPCDVTYPQSTPTEPEGNVGGGTNTTTVVIDCSSRPSSSDTAVHSLLIGFRALQNDVRSVNGSSDDDGTAPARQVTATGVPWSSGVHRVQSAATTSSSNRTPSPVNMTVTAAAGFATSTASPPRMGSRGATRTSLLSLQIRKSGSSGNVAMLALASASSRGTRRPGSVRGDADAQSQPNAGVQRLVDTLMSPFNSRTVMGAAPVLLTGLGGDKLSRTADGGVTCTSGASALKFVDASSKPNDSARLELFLPPTTMMMADAAAPISSGSSLVLHHVSNIDVVAVDSNEKSATEPDTPGCTIVMTTNHSQGQQPPPTTATGTAVAPQSMHGILQSYGHVGRVDNAGGRGGVPLMMYDDDGDGDGEYIHGDDTPFLPYATASAPACTAPHCFSTGDTAMPSVTSIVAAAKVMLCDTPEAPPPPPSTTTSTQLPASPPSDTTRSGFPPNVPTGVNAASVATGAAASASLHIPLKPSTFGRSMPMDAPSRTRSVLYASPHCGSPNTVAAGGEACSRVPGSGRVSRERSPGGDSGPAGSPLTGVGYGGVGGRLCGLLDTLSLEMTRLGAAKMGPRPAADEPRQSEFGMGASFLLKSGSYTAGAPTPVAKPVQPSTRRGLTRQNTHERIERLLNLARGGSTCEPAAAAAGSIGCVTGGGVAAAQSAGAGGGGAVAAAGSTAKSAAAATSLADGGCGGGVNGCPVTAPVGGAAKGPVWHQVHVCVCCHPVTSCPVLVVTQNDVTRQMDARTQLTMLLEREQKILESIFPRHVIEYLTLQQTPSDVPGRTRLSAPGQLSPGPAPTATGPFATASSVVSAGAGGGGGAGGPLSAHRDTAARLASVATAHPCVTILFADIVGFTNMCKQVTPLQVMTFLNALYSRFDELLDIYKVYKVETIGDCFMVAGGLVGRDEEGWRTTITNDQLHAVRVLEFAKAMLREAIKVQLPTGGPVMMRVGIHSGPVMSGVVGSRMPRFCLFGDTVNTASRMESTSRPGRIHVSADTHALLPNERWEPTGGVQVKGKGVMPTYLWASNVAEEKGEQLQRVLGVYL